MEQSDSDSSMGITAERNGIRLHVAFEGSCLNLLLYRKNETEACLRVPFSPRKKVGTVWRMELSYDEIRKAGFTKAELLQAEYRFEGDAGGFADPYGKSFSGREDWGKAEQPGAPLRSPLFLPPFAWGEDRRPETPLCDSVIYRLHVRGFTMNRGSKVKQRGTFGGVVEKIPYLKELGVTAIELLPMQEFEEVMPKGEGSRLNYWGYTKAYHFAPKAGYCRKRRQDPAGEFRTLVRECHRAGLEVITELYFQGDEDYAYILSVLRYYVTFFHVDGIHVTGVKDVHVFSRDPYLSRTKLLAERWSEGTGKTAILAASNEDFQRDMRRFLKGDEGMLKALCFHIGASGDAAVPIHFLANTNGFTMMDMVSYNEKHNLENGEENRDGTDYNYSWNCGAEGATGRKSVRALREKQLRNGFLLLFLCRGTPLILAGDEFGNSQGGNNNAYCQDNPVSWLDWNKLRREKALFGFVKDCIAFRKKHGVLRRAAAPLFMDPEGYGMPDVSYHGVRAWRPDFEPRQRRIGILYNGEYARDAAGKADACLYVMYNMHWEAQDFALPHPPKGDVWHLAVSTEQEEGTFFQPEGEEPRLLNQQLFWMPPRSIAVLISRRAPNEGKARRAPKKEEPKRRGKRPES